MSPVKLNKVPFVIHHYGPDGLSIAEGCRLMGLSRSTYCNAPVVQADDGEIVAAMTTICDEFES